MPQQSTSPFYPSQLKDPRYAADLKQVLYDNFFLINEGPGFSQQPTRVSGQPNSIVGHPNFGPQWVNAVFIDSLRSRWCCILSGTPGTWMQLDTPVVSSFPTTTVVGYRVIRSDLGFAEYYFDGSTWLITSGDGTVVGAANLGTGADGEGVYSTTMADVLLFKRIKDGGNITLTSAANNITIAVQDSPHFVGTTTVDIFKIVAQPAPTTQVDDSILSWVESTGSSPTKTIVWKGKHRDGSEFILSSVIV